MDIDDIHKTTFKTHSGHYENTSDLEASLRRVSLVRERPRVVALERSL